MENIWRQTCVEHYTMENNVSCEGDDEIINGAQYHFLSGVVSPYFCFIFVISSCFLLSSVFLKAWEIKGKEISKI